MPTNILTFTNTRLQPALYPDDARTSNGKYGANLTIPSGCVIGRKTSDGLLYPTISINAIQTATANVAATGGTFTIKVLNSSGVYATTTALAYNASIATIQTALDVASGVANGIVASSAGSAAPFSTPTPLILTFSGTGYANLDQPLVTVDYSLLVGANIVVANQQPNRVQTITPTTAASAGHFIIAVTQPTGVRALTGPIAYNASLATIQASLDIASGVANGIVATSAASAAPFSTPTPLILTFSGTGYANLPQPMVGVEIGGDVVGTTEVTINDTTTTRDGTDVPVGFAIFGFKTDANSVAYLTTGTAQVDLVATPMQTAPIYIAGTFNTADLVGWNGGMLAQMNGRTVAPGIVRIP